MLVPCLVPGTGTDHSSLEQVQVASGMRHAMRHAACFSFQFRGSLSTSSVLFSHY
jgi:hypothetical protein